MKKALLDDVIKKWDKDCEKFRKNMSPEIKKLRDMWSRSVEREKKEEAELPARLSPGELEFRKWLETVMSKLAGYLSMHHFSSEKEMKDYIKSGNKVLKPFMDELVKYSEAELKKFLTRSDWDFICSSYRIYKMKGIVPLQHVAIH